jgi:hypothetical protein
MVILFRRVDDSTRAMAHRLACSRIDGRDTELSPESRFIQVAARRRLTWPRTVYSFANIDRDTWVALSWVLRKLRPAAWGSPSRLTRLPLIYPIEIVPAYRFGPGMQMTHTAGNYSCSDPKQILLLAWPSGAAPQASQI